MPTTIEEIEAAIEQASAPGFRGRLLARGQARAMIWREGVLPRDAPAFSRLLSYDLHSYAYSMLGLGLRLRELGGDEDLARSSFEQAASALESVIARGNPEESDRDFHVVIAAAAYHLARLSARAYSLLTIVQRNENFSLVEQALAHLMLRDLGTLEREVVANRMAGAGSDASIRALFENRWAAISEVDRTELDSGRDFLFEGMDLALTDNYFAAMAVFLLALERGDRDLVNQATVRIREGQAVAGDLNLLPQWWVHKITAHIFEDLWSSTFHERLPRQPQGGPAPSWESLRTLFIAVLLCRGKAEIDLWPSQIAGAARAVDQRDDLVVSLPTSAGKTRIAELCILRCLAAGRRVIFVTPLRALSAQTEVVLRRTFAPLGKTISALYGSIGISGVDEDAIRLRDIVVATPEKLDFAIRNDPSLLDDVGLLVFDEGHMIGLNEREVRYEVQIQRLLCRPDAQGRRIVCLSAILPDGDQLDDFANWMRRDKPGGVVKSAWRPTRLRYGEVMWEGQTARLNLRVGEERPFVSRFLTGSIPPIGRRAKLFPSDLGELCLATAWKLVDEGQSVLVFCPVRAHVEPFAGRIVDLHKRGALRSLLAVDGSQLRNALVLGSEWLGEDHPILQCLRLGVAIHHGALPAAFRREIERLLKEGVLKVTISSPTLAQGLNLSATVVIFHSLFRNRERIETSEFKNVVGRAGRAFVDVEGLVLYPIFDKHRRRLSQWEGLIADLSSREMESGLIRLLVTLLLRMIERIGAKSSATLVEFVLNNSDAWTFHELADDDPEAGERTRDRWENHVATLDTAILSLLGEHEIPADAIAAKLDEVLTSSLWERRLRRQSEAQKQVLRSGLQGRAQYIWARSTVTQRKGYFLAGIGFGAGRGLDAVAGQANELLVLANGAIQSGDRERAIESITAIAEMVFVIGPFKPDPLPDNWRETLRAWLLGLPLADVAAGQEEDTLQFVENGLVYRLPWAMEAIRVRGVANRDTVGNPGMTLEDFDLSVAASAVETGTLNCSASILIQAGFSSRLAAIKAIADTGATFTDNVRFRRWLSSAPVRALESRSDWPTPETSGLWQAFREGLSPQTNAVWKEQRYWASATWLPGVQPVADSPVRILGRSEPGNPTVLSASGENLGTVAAGVNPKRKGLLLAEVMADPTKVLLRYFGPEDLWQS